MYPPKLLSAACMYCIWHCAIVHCVVVDSVTLLTIVHWLLWCTWLFYRFCTWADVDSSVEMLGLSRLTVCCWSNVVFRNLCCCNMLYMTACFCCDCPCVLWDHGAVVDFYRCCWTGTHAMLTWLLLGITVPCYIWCVTLYTHHCILK